MHGAEFCKSKNWRGYVHGAEFCKSKNWRGYVHGAEFCKSKNWRGYVHGAEFLHKQKLGRVNNGACTVISLPKMLHLGEDRIYNVNMTRGRNVRYRLVTYAREMRHEPTEAEDRLWRELRAHRFDGVHFRRQHPMGRYIADFCAPRQKLIIEVDGGQHLAQQDYDNERSAFLASKGYRVLRFWNDAVFKNMEGVIVCILDALLPQPAPAEAGAGGAEGDEITRF